MELITTITDKEITGKEVKFEGVYSNRSAVRAIVFNSENKIAILHAKKYKFHKLPGGGIEKEESKEKALERELQEEIGCKVKITKEIGKITEIKNKYGQKQDSFCYVAKIISKGSLNLTKEEKDDSGIEVQWATLDNAIKIFKKDSPSDYTAKFIRYRDLIFLKELK